MNYWYERRQPRASRLDDTRTAGQVDYARVVHSASFRRLQGKTQILNLGDSDFYRTRLTHSLEVAQIAVGIGQHLAASAANHSGADFLPDNDLLQAIGLTHDLGHPPFGHGGEVALNYCMRDAGGFEGNGQTIRILGRLENFQADVGANLTRRTMLGVLKYPAPFSAVVNPEIRPHLGQGATVARLIDRVSSKPPKCYLDCESDIVDWILSPLRPAEREIFCSFEEKSGRHGKPRHKSFDCSIMDLADDIAFGVHDLEDAIALDLISREAFTAAVPLALCRHFLRRLGASSPGAESDAYAKMLGELFGQDDRVRKHTIGALVNYFIVECLLESLEEFDEPLLRHRATLSPDASSFLDGLISAVREEVIFNAAVQQLEFKGQVMVVKVFEAMASDPAKLLPRQTRVQFDAATSPEGQLRVICDHISGMTDGFLLKTYDRLFSPRMGSVFDLV